MQVKPSNIFYSHDTIMYRFRKRNRRSRSISIGDTLDELCDGSCKISDIPRITITKKNGKWHTLDNRRLWVFHHYEAHLNTEGRSLTITADEVEYSPSDHEKRFTTKNGGESIVVVKGSPGGKKQIVPVTPRVVEQTAEEKESENNVASEKRIGETKDEPIITDEIDDDSSVMKDKIASFSENSFGLSIGNTDINIGFSASTLNSIVSITSSEKISATDATADNTDESIAPSDKTNVTIDEMSTTTVKITAPDKISAPDDDTICINGGISAQGDKTNVENLVPSNTTDEATDKILPACTVAIYKGDTSSHTDTTIDNTDEVARSADASTSTSRIMFATIDANAVTVGEISAPTIAISIDESSPTEEAAIATGGKSEQINTNEGTTKYEMASSELAEKTYGSERHEDQTRKRGLSENSTQSSEDCLEVKRLKTDYDLNETL